MVTTKPSERTVESLGAPIFTRTSSRANILAGIVFGLLLTGGGVALCWYRIHEMARRGPIACPLIGGIRRTGQ